MFKGVNVCVYVGEGLRRSFATPNPFVLTNKICLNQTIVLVPAIEQDKYYKGRDDSCIFAQCWQA